MMRRVFPAGILAAVLVLSSFVFARQASVDPEIQKIAQAYEQAWAKGDAKALAALYAENGVRAGSDGQVYTGRAAIEQGFVKLFGGAFKGSKIAVRTEQEQVIVKDSVHLMIGTYEVSGVANPPAGVSLKGRFVNTAVKQGGRWIMASSSAIGMAPR